MSCIVCRTTPGAKCPNGLCDPLSLDRLHDLEVEVALSQSGMEVAVVDRDDGETVQALLEFYRKHRLHECATTLLQDWRYQELCEIDATRKRHLEAVHQAAERYIAGRCLLNELVEATSRYNTWKESVNGINE